MTYVAIAVLVAGVVLLKLNHRDFSYFSHLYVAALGVGVERWRWVAIAIGADAVLMYAVQWVQFARAGWRPAQSYWDGQTVYGPWIGAPSVGHLPRVHTFTTPLHRLLTWAMEKL